MPIIAVTKVKIKFSELYIYHTVKVVDNISHDLILGTDFMRQNAATIDYRSGLISICDNLAALPLQSNVMDKYIVQNMQKVCIPSYSEMILPVSIPLKFNNKTVIIEPIPDFQFKICAIAKSMSKCENEKTVCKILNYNCNNILLKKGTRIGRIVEPADIISCVAYKDQTQIQEEKLPSVKTEQSRENLEQFLKEYGFTISPYLTINQRYELLTLLYSYKDVFARSLRDIKTYPNYELDLELISPRKAFRRQYKLNVQDAETAEAQIAEMKTIAVVETADSAEFNSPLFLVGKKNDSKPLVVDLRLINALIKPQLVSLPIVSEMLNDILSSKPKYLSVCDLKSGYWQITMAKSARHLTAFTSPVTGQRLQFTRCPFGLNNSPAVMLQIFTTLFAGRGQTDNMWVYMDDIISGLSSWGQNLKKIGGYVTNFTIKLQSYL